MMKQSQRPSYRAWYDANKARIIQKQKERAPSIPVEVRRAYHRAWYAKKKLEDPNYFKEKSRREYHKNPAHKAALARNTRKRLKDEFFAEYGGKCACCGEEEQAFLTLEHKQRDGKAHRGLVGTSLTAQLRDLKTRGWPKDVYEVLCFNCNRASWEHGICPHRRTHAAE